MGTVYLRTTTAPDSTYQNLNKVLTLSELDNNMTLFLRNDVNDTMNGNLTINGTLSANNIYSNGVQLTSGGIPSGSMLISYLSSPPTAEYVLLDGSYQSVTSYPILATLGFPTRPAFDGTVGGIAGNPNNVVDVEAYNDQYNLGPTIVGPNLLDGSLSWDDWAGAGWHTQNVDLAAETAAYAIFTFPIATVLHTYAILPRSGNGGNTDRWWVYQWKWYASNDKQNWTLLEHQNSRTTGEAYMLQGSNNIDSAGGFYQNNWNITNDTIFNNLDRGFNGSQTAYKHYKFVPLDGEWGTNSYIFVNEIRLKGISYPANTNFRKVPLAPNQGGLGFYYYLKG